MLKSDKEAKIPLLTPIWDNSEDAFLDFQEEINEEKTHQEKSLILNEEDEYSNDNKHSSLESCLTLSVRKIKVIGPQHTTLINPDIREENILPYAR
ncbi:hypothetical protein O181_062377 [Austropuccinia psidii MF-1]|uniref:Uncharacterized protein n=1 Tax=Austropuccinia psidii MF-1 TaxID=1389203 RepID=A0A9Q3ES36_9BASI|nr:hypothetical protein [Austropuccinia psidii MF-1]